MSVGSWIGIAYAITNIIFIDFDFYQVSYLMYDFIIRLIFDAPSCGTGYWRLALSGWLFWSSVPSFWWKIWWSSTVRDLSGTILCILYKRYCDYYWLIDRFADYFVMLDQSCKRQQCTKQAGGSGPRRSRSLGIKKAQWTWGYWIGSELISRFSWARVIGRWKLLNSAVF